MNDTRVTLPRAVSAELLGTMLLLATIVGSGIMAETLAGGNTALALLGNTLSTGSMLVVLILVFGPISGAHFNPVVSGVMALRGQLPGRWLVPYLGAQVLGAVLGVVLAHSMFELPPLAWSPKARIGLAQTLSELVATFGLIGTILAVARTRAATVPLAVGLYISAAYWFTASTSFANPAVTIARALTPTFSGIEPHGVPWFIGAQVCGALLGSVVFAWLLDERRVSLE